MTFKDAMEHYRAGTATEEERQLIEQELEKNRLITEYLDEQWDDTDSTTISPVEEMNYVRKTLHKRNAMIILTSLVLAAALLLGVIFIGIPAVESLYWDPTAASYDANTTDLELTLTAYTELFCPDINLSHVAVEKSGFGKYALSIRYWNSHRGGDTYYTSGTIEKGDLTLPTNFLDYCPVNIFERATYPFYPAQEDHLQTVYEKLSQLPEYVTVVAAVSFPADKSMQELLSFNDDLIKGEVVWTAIRNSPLEEQNLPLCGIGVASWGSVRTQINSDYPCFDIKGETKTPENLETHFKSLLRLSADQLKNGTGISAGRSEDRSGYFNEVLNYVEENGIYSYGCYVIGTPETFLALIESGAVSQIRIEDIWFSVS